MLNFFKLTLFLMFPADPPGQPPAPEVQDKTTSSVTLGWSPPDKDGGSPIKGYIVEVQDEGVVEWKRVNQPDKLILSTAYTVSGLKENKKCRFRIVAVNAAGESEPSPRTADTIVKDILGKIAIYEFILKYMLKTCICHLFIHVVNLTAMPSTSGDFCPFV